MRSGHLAAWVAACLSLLAAGPLLSGPSGIPPLDPESGIHRYSIFDANRNDGWGAADSTDGSPLAWLEGPILSDYLSLYRVSGDRAWLDRLCRHFDRMLGNATELEGGGLGWPSRRYTTDGSPQVYLVHEGMILLPVVEFAVLAVGDPRMPADLAQRGSRYLEVVLDRFLPKWDATWTDLSDSTGAYCFPDVPGERNRGRPLPHNQMAPHARMFFLLQEVRNLPVLLDRARRMTRLLAADLRPAGSGWVWHYWSVPGPDGPGMVEDVSHGGLDVALAVDACRRGEVLTPADIDRFAATLVDTMWNGSRTQPAVSRRVDGTGGDAPALFPVRGWADLGGVRPEVLDLCLLLFHAQGESPSQIPALLAAQAQTEEAPR